MNLKHPVITLTAALTNALERDLQGVEQPGAAGTATRRPLATECTVVMFTQTWKCAEINVDGPRDDQYADAETVIVSGPEGDACVYVSTRLLYKVEHPNRRFFLDVAAQQMRGHGQRHCYDGRDSADQEAFDFEIAGALARARGAARQLERCDAERVARMLRQCLEEFEHINPHGFFAANGAKTGVASAPLTTR